MSEKYGLHCEFDIEQHKKTFINYFEVVIDENGKVMYAVPSHQEKAIAEACKKLNITRGELITICPPEYYGDFLLWLCMKANIIAVWNEHWLGANPTKRQIQTLKKLKLNGLYKGPIPLIDKKRG